MRVTKVTREYFVLEDEKVYFDEPLDHDLTIEEMQGLWNDAQTHINKLVSNGKLSHKCQETEKETDKDG